MILWCMFVALIGGAGPVWGAQQGDQGEPVEWIFIDGAKEPGLLAEWRVWEGVLGGIYTIRHNRLEGSPLDSLAVTPSELKRLEKAAFWYNKHFHDCYGERQEKEVARLRAAKRPDDEVFKRQRAVILECRQMVLDRADALLRDMSDKGRVALLAYVEARKRTLWSRFAKSELWFYRLPR